MQHETLLFGPRRSPQPRTARSALAEIVVVLDTDIVLGDQIFARIVNRCRPKSRLLSRWQRPHGEPMHSSARGSGRDVVMATRRCRWKPTLFVGTSRAYARHSYKGNALVGEMPCYATRDFRTGRRPSSKRSGSPSHTGRRSRVCAPHCGLQRRAGSAAISAS